MIRFAIPLLLTCVISPCLAAETPPLRDRYWCLAHLLDRAPLCGAACEFEPLLDIQNPESIRSRLPGVKISEAASTPERYAALRSFPIGQVTAAPGHAYLRNPQQLSKLKNYIADSGGGDFTHDPLLFNLVTDDAGDMITVDLWNAHHRLVAYLEAGYHFLDEIPERNFKILVNGRTAEGAVWPHFLSVAGLDETQRFEQWAVPVTGDIRNGTVSVGGSLPNFSLGSRNTVGQLRKNMLYRKQPKVGVYFGSFDPPHSGHLQVARKAIAAMGYDEIIIVPNATVAEKPGLTPVDLRIRMLQEFIQGEPRMNLYVGDSRYIVDRFGRDPLIERFGQIYGTQDIHQIIGEDSYLNLLAQGQIHANSNRKFVVFPRPGARSGGSAPLHAPAHLAEKVDILPEYEISDLSSTLVRRLIAESRPTDESILAPGVRRIADEMNLYRNR